MIIIKIFLIKKKRVKLFNNQKIFLRSKIKIKLSKKNEFM